MRLLGQAYAWAAASVTLLLAVSNTLAQGTLAVDQASGPFEESITTGYFTPDNRLAQSFTPSLPAVGFVQLETMVLDNNAGRGVLFVVHLREGELNGPIISSTTPVVLVNFLINEKKTFFFPENVSVTSGQLYFFELMLQSSGRLFIGFKSPSSYDRGDLFANGVPSGGVADLWFREGVVVPEPSTLILACAGGSLLLLRISALRKNP